MDFSDYLAIQNLIHRYPQCADRGDFDRVGEIYADAVVSVVGHQAPFFQAEGAEKFSEFYKKTVRRFQDSKTPKTRHLIGNIIVEDDGPGRARAESYVVVFQRTETLPLQPIVAGTYFDRFTKIDGTWRLVERKEDMELVGNLSEHLLLADPMSEETVRKTRS